jgi:aryl-alcohol dehydrogenase-like predicted oxidoreductase
MTDTTTTERIEMETVRLGRTALQVTPVAYGTWQFGGDWGGVDEAATLEAIRYARALGVNFFDTAQAYGFGISEQLAIAWTLANPAVQVAIVGARRREHLGESVGAAALRLSADDMARIEGIMGDAVQVAGPSPETV